MRYIYIYIYLYLCVWTHSYIKLNIRYPHITTITSITTKPIYNWEIYFSNPVSKMDSCDHQDCRARRESLTHCGLVAPHDDMDLSQHWLRQWLAAWLHQAITWTNIDFSPLGSNNIHLWTISPEIPQPTLTKITFKTIYLQFHSHLPGANESYQDWVNGTLLL